MLWGTVSKALQKSRYDGVWLGNYICQFPQDPGVHLLESNGLVYLQVPQVVSNLNFSYEGRDFVPLVPALRFGDLRDPVPMLDHPFGEEIFPNIQSKPPLVQLEAISSCPIACYLGEETDNHLATTSFQVVVESDTVSPQPPFLQAKQPQSPQPLLIRLLL
ncbi:hypothetical protein QYF61_005623 [Mycteria americana]|uniref:Uncharacterized protein n=1 Tax=Mycteria americana TaxID=33587 RepID=A0AAN7MZP6_MYCAM|nr:hypothetical protein QYF61_005623 [Mycteria americana]